MKKTALLKTLSIALASMLLLTPQIRAEEEKNPIDNLTAEFGVGTYFLIFPFAGAKIGYQINDRFNIYGGYSYNIAGFRGNLEHMGSLGAKYYILPEGSFKPFIRLETSLAQQTNYSVTELNYISNAPPLYYSLILGGLGFDWMFTQQYGLYFSIIGGASNVLQYWMINPTFLRSEIGMKVNF